MDSLTQFLDTALTWDESNTTLDEIMEYIDDEWPNLITEDDVIAALYALKYLVNDGEVLNVALLW